MQNFVILYRIEKIMCPTDEPFGFQCYAEEQCINAYPDCDIVWAWVGEFGVGMDSALDDYYNNAIV